MLDKREIKIRKELPNENYIWVFEGEIAKVGNDGKLKCGQEIGEGNVVVSDVLAVNNTVS